MSRVVAVFALVGYSAGIRHGATTKSHWKALHMDAAQDRDTELVLERRAQGWSQNVTSNGTGCASSLNMAQSNMSVQNESGDPPTPMIRDLLKQGVQGLKKADEHAASAQQTMSTLQAKLDQHLKEYISMIEEQKAVLKSAEESILDAGARIPVKKQGANEGDMIQEIKTAEEVRITKIKSALEQLAKWDQLGKKANDTQKSLTSMGFAANMKQLLTQAEEFLQKAKNARLGTDLSQVTSSATANPGSMCERLSESGIGEIICQCDDMYKVFEQTLPPIAQHQGASYTHGFTLAAMRWFIETVLNPKAHDAVDIAAGVTSVCGSYLAKVGVKQNDLTTSILAKWEDVKAILKIEQERIDQIAQSLQKARAPIQDTAPAIPPGKATAKLGTQARTEMEALEAAQRLDQNRMEVLKESQNLLREAREAWKKQGQPKIEEALRFMISNVQTKCGSLFTKTDTVVEQLNTMLTTLETLPVRYDAAYSATVIEFGGDLTESAV